MPNLLSRLRTLSTSVGSMASMSRCAYPLLIGLVLIGYGLCLSAGVGSSVSAYAMVSVGVLAIVGLEIWIPYRQSWQPTKSELLTDALYLALVQVGLPVLITTSVVRVVNAEGGWFWPQAWPLVAQLILMVLIADLLRYGLHVLAHRWAWLWRLHAVHHSPRKLYAMNVARFHPVEKVFQYCLDALPFVLIGVHPDVIGAYLVFYAVNGFFQHANVDVRLGYLNWLINGPELHRWHHSEDPSQAAHNYGNNLIIWDVLFRTRWLPDDSQVSKLGILNRARVQTSWWDTCLNVLWRVHMTWVRQTSLRALQRAAADPGREQLGLLRQILAANSPTRFGEQHGFDSISSIEEYRARVPVQTFESLRPYIDRQETSGAWELTVAPPVLYTRTSGTTAAPKYLPYVADALVDYRRQQRVFACSQYQTLPEAFAGSILAIVSPGIEGYRESGIPYGSASGQVCAAMPRLARRKYVVPPEVFELEDSTLKYRLILRLALSRSDITCAGSANPTTFLKLQDLLVAHRRELLQDCEAETFASLELLPTALRHLVVPRLRCTRERLDQLREVLSAPDPTLASCWPRLRLVSTWTGGSCGVALQRAREVLPPDVVVADLGYLASEFRGTINVDINTDSCVPTIQHTFFEFVERESWEGGNPVFRELTELEHGLEYYVIITTRSGLYRYFMNDIIRTTGTYFSTPTIEFVRKGLGVTNITGEKLAEDQVIQAVQSAAAELGFSARFFVALADREQTKYRLHIEYGGSPGTALLSRRIDEHLRDLNLEYDDKRASGRLGALLVVSLEDGTSEAYERHCVTGGRREGQWKAQVVQYKDEDQFSWLPFVTAIGSVHA